MERKLQKTQKIIEALNLSSDRNLRDIEGSLEKIRSFYALHSTRLEQLERYTGLRAKDFSKSKLELKDKDFVL